MCTSLQKETRVFGGKQSEQSKQEDRKARKQFVGTFAINQASEKESKNQIKRKARLLGSKTLGAIARIPTPNEAIKHKAKCKKSNKKAKGIISNSKHLSS